ncbi:lytic transglycosylase domain-containing protein [Actimicrobium sp. CCI2.3]|uniref:lytic transglycosylase domain-containing protein n=2 Tax=Actimicrobium sp. CCI2.3 TaxID=3048616 RepID=UPI002B247DBE|nr:lytic transglycosylase domain-containing protein [Actimicrobium sp. CCI2.3]MEB0022689.1 lytic transglycosylase domain-containing protein [Actimicrobium sp. CCI2.3]
MPPSYRPIPMHLAFFTALLLLSVAPAAHACWEEAAQRYNVNPAMLVAIARTESSMNPNAINRNRNGSYDLGLMQINSRWFPLLRQYGIGEQQLRDPCTSIHVGAWILSQNMQRLGNSWDAVGAYNSSQPAQRAAYARRVYRNLPR